MRFARKSLEDVFSWVTDRMHRKITQIFTINVMVKSADFGSGFDQALYLVAGYWVLLATTCLVQLSSDQKLNFEMPKSTFLVCWGSLRGCEQLTERAPFKDELNTDRGLA